MTKLTHKQLKKIALSRAGVKKEYDSLKEEFDLFEAMIKARLEAGKTQEDVAKAMKTSTSVVGRLETGGGAHRHSPTYESLRRYAKAVNCNLIVMFEPQRAKVVNLKGVSGSRRAKVVVNRNLKGVSEPRTKGVFAHKKAHRKEKATGSQIVK